MCGRFTQHYTWSQVNEFLSVVGAPLNLRPRYNVAPTTEIDVVRLDQNGRREPVHMPVLLTPDLFDVWLSGSGGADALRPAAECALREWVVSDRVNRTGQGDDDPTLVETV